MRCGLDSIVFKDKNPFLFFRRLSFVFRYLRSVFCPLSSDICRLASPAIHLTAFQ